MTEYYKVKMDLLEQAVNELDVINNKRTITGLDLLYQQYKCNTSNVFDMQPDGMVIIGVNPDTIEDVTTSKILGGKVWYYPYVDDDDDKPMQSRRHNMINNTYYGIDPHKIISRLYTDT